MVIFIVENLLQAIISAGLGDSSYCMFMEEVIYRIIFGKLSASFITESWQLCVSLTPRIVDVRMT
jgi:hypothetical protein